MREEKILKFDPNINIVSYRWFEPDMKVKGVIEIFHGMAENILRYEDMAQEFVKNGFMVIGHDHVGHGKSVDSYENVGKIENYDFMSAIIMGMKLVRDEYAEYFENTKRCAFAHSMGSMAMQRYLQKYPNDFDYVVLSGTDIGGGKYHFCKAFTKLFIKKDKITYSKTVLNLTMGGFNKKFKHEHPKYGWLSRNLDNIKSYEENEYCGADFPTNYYYSLSKMMCETVKKENLNKINPNIKLFIYSGCEDPVSSYGKSILKLAKKYQSHGLNVTYKIIPDARHEVHNEKEEVRTSLIHDLIEFYLK
ncbi:MAG: alpha/beta fold hydrolase [Bacilli bacterium]